LSSVPEVGKTDLVNSGKRELLKASHMYLSPHKQLRFWVNGGGLVLNRVFVASRSAVKPLSGKQFEKLGVSGDVHSLPVTNHWRDEAKILIFCEIPRRWGWSKSPLYLSYRSRIAQCK
jgi:hypothetical protein